MVCSATHTRKKEHLKPVHHNLVCNYGVSKAKMSRAGVVFVLVAGFHSTWRKFQASLRLTEDTFEYPFYMLLLAICSMRILSI